jgi:hypothetical protein
MTDLLTWNATVGYVDNVVPTIVAPIIDQEIQDQVPQIIQDEMPDVIAANDIMTGFAWKIPLLGLDSNSVHTFDVPLNIEDDHVFTASIFGGPDGAGLETQGIRVQDVAGGVLSLKLFNIVSVVLPESWAVIQVIEQNIL